MRWAQHDDPRANLCPSCYLVGETHTIYLCGSRCGSSRHVAFRTHGNAALCITAKSAADVRFGSFTTEAGKAKGRSTSASPQKRTNGKPSRHVRLVANTGHSLDISFYG